MCPPLDPNVHNLDRGCVLLRAPVNVSLMQDLCAAESWKRSVLHHIYLARSRMRTFSPLYLVSPLVWCVSGIVADNGRIPLYRVPRLRSSNRQNLDVHTDLSLDTSNQL